VPRVPGSLRTYRAQLVANDHIASQRPRAPTFQAMARILGPRKNRITAWCQQPNSAGKTG
jgi:hypothetical protein